MIVNISLLIFLFFINFTAGYVLGRKTKHKPITEMEYLPSLKKPIFTHKAQIVDLQDPLDLIEI